MRLHPSASHVDQAKGAAMTNQTYWVVQLEALSFDSKEKADAFRDKVEEALMAMPDSETLTFFTAVTEEADE